MSVGGGVGWSGVEGECRGWSGVEGECRGRSGSVT